MHLFTNSWRRQDGEGQNLSTSCRRLADVRGMLTGRFLSSINDFTLIWEGARVADSNRVQRSPHLWETGRRDGFDFIRRMSLTMCL